MLGLGLDALDLGSSLSWEVVLGPPPSMMMVLKLLVVEQGECVENVGGCGGGRI